jgi:hypothetical protein
LNKRAIQLHKFYAKKEDYEKNKALFGEALLKVLTKEVWMRSYQGQNMPQEHQTKMQQESQQTPEMSEVYTSLVSYENNLKLKKWAQRVVEANVDALNGILELKKKTKEEESQGSTISYIGQTIAWLGTGAASYGASYLTS